jgi:DNA mismatch repair ATPase MutS
MDYQHILSSNTESIKILTKRSNLVSFARLLFALILIYTLYHIFKTNVQSIWVGLGLISFSAFLYMVSFHQKIKEKIQCSEALILICRNEILAKKGLFAQFYDGKDYENRVHQFSLDLDIFGEKSIFQLLNRTFTQNGRDKLSRVLETPYLEPEIITERQDSIKELKEKTDWRIKFLAQGKLLDEDSDKLKQLKSWLIKDPVIYHSKFKILTWLTPILNLSFLFLVLLQIIPYKVVSICYLIQFMIGWFNHKKIGRFYVELSSQSKSLDKYRLIFQTIEQESFQSNLIKSKQAIITNISSKIYQLFRITKLFEFRNNFLGMPFYTLLFGDYSSAFRLEEWRKKYSQDLLKAFEVLNEFEVFVSIASFAHANRNYIFPEVSKTIKLDILQLGHPLLNEGVCNDFSIKKDEQLFIVTGANMAGKSTFLRAIGANMILAMIGAPVCATKFVFRPVYVFTCMRITDSVGEGESYFHAELARLQRIVKLLDESQEIFVILDELLKGTNSKDKLVGSELFIEKLLNFPKIAGLIATHDLALTTMTEKYPTKIKNICFEVVIKGDNMTFDYKLRDGVTQNMNALILMRQMEII